jgi:hypothetical protein
VQPRDGGRKVSSTGLAVEVVQQPVEVDVVGLQAPQRVLELLHDRLTTGPAGVRVVLLYVAEELGREDESIIGHLRGTEGEAISPHRFSESRAGLIT